MASPSRFGAALLEARQALHLTQARVAAEVGKRPLSVLRWEKKGYVPTMEDRIAILRLMSAAPRPLLEALAEASHVQLGSIGLGAPPPPAPAPQPGALPASAQATVDDALREAAEELDVSARALRPAVSRMLDRIARAGVPVDAAARMVLRVPKKEGGKKAGA